MIDEQRLAMEEILRGKRLRELTKVDGWQDALDLLENRVVAAEALSLNYRGSDKEVSFALQRRASVAREMFHNFQIDIARVVEATLIPPDVSPVGSPGGW